MKNKHKMLIQTIAKEGREMGEPRRTLQMKGQRQHQHCTNPRDLPPGATSLLLPQWTENKLGQLAVWVWDEAACAPALRSGSSAELLPWKSHQPGLCSQELRPALAPHHSSSEPAFSLGGTRSSHQEAIVQGRRGGHRRPGLWGKGFESMVDFAAGQRELTDEGAPGQEPSSLQSPETRTAGPLHKVAGPSAGQREAVERMHRKTGKRRQGGQKPSAPAQSLQRSCSQLRRLLQHVRRMAGGCFAATDLASTL